MDINTTLRSSFSHRCRFNMRRTTIPCVCAAFLGNWIPPTRTVGTYFMGPGSLRCVGYRTMIDPFMLLRGRGFCYSSKAPKESFQQPGGSYSRRVLSIYMRMRCCCRCGYCSPRVGCINFVQTDVADDRANRANFTMDESLYNSKSPFSSSSAQRQPIPTVLFVE